MSFIFHNSGQFDRQSFAQLLVWRFLVRLCITWRQSFLTQKYFLSTTSLAWSLALYLLVCSDTHTHTHTHTHTTRTHTRSIYIIGWAKWNEGKSCKSKLFSQLVSVAAVLKGYKVIVIYKFFRSSFLMSYYNSRKLF